MNLIQKIIIILLILIGVGFLLQQSFIQKPVLNLIKRSIPWSIPTFTFVKDNVLSGSLIGLLIYLMFVNIPILPSPPAEAYAIFAFLKGTNIFGILFITTLVYMFVAAIYYFIGRLYGQRMLEKILKKSVGHSSFLDRFMTPLIFFSYLLPIPFPIPITTVLILFAGTYKTKFIKVMAAVGMATLLRFSAIITLYHFYTPKIEHYLSHLNY